MSGPVGSGPIGEVLWTPSPERVARSAMERFRRTAPGEPADYDALWRWSVEDLPGFWAKAWDDLGVRASTPYERVMGESRMPGTEWFPGAQLNFAEHLLARTDDRPAVIAAGEGMDDRAVSAAELRRLVARAQAGLRALGVGAGDRVAGIVPNTLETLVLMLATTATGGIWSSCSPDFGPMGVVDRFGQIQPKVLVTADGYRYGGKTFGLSDKVRAVLDAMPDIAHVVAFGFAGTPLDVGRDVIAYDDLLVHDAAEPDFVPLPFDHPLYIMYSSGTTGVPKSIVHGAGGTLLKHLVEHRLHSDVGPGDTVFWFSTCGWMMWNWLVSGLAAGACVVLYDGSPTHPGPETLWQMAERTGVTHFGTSPKFLAACEQADVSPREIADLSAVRTVLSTGSPLNPEQFDWVYAHVADEHDPDLQLASISGGTDLIGCFAAGNPLLPVRRGELQSRVLGMAVEAFDPQGRPVVGDKGELVCTRPFPSMPVGFWNDPDGERYRKAYFADFPGVWTHGDFVEIRPSGGVVIYGRSDTTLNPGGVRIGTAEIYRAIEPLPEIADAIVVGRPVDGDVEVVLCVVLTEGAALDDELAARIKRTIREATTPRHVPAHVFAVREVPYTISGKKVEKAVRSMMTGEPVDNRDALANPGALDEYAALPFPG
jgi:acetoacetyl-CoA synthetase